MLTAGINRIRFALGTGLAVGGTTYAYHRHGEQHGLPGNMGWITPSKKIALIMGGSSSLMALCLPAKHLVPGIVFLGGMLTIASINKSIEEIKTRNAAINRSIEEIRTKNEKLTFDRLKNSQQSPPSS